MQGRYKADLLSYSWNVGVFGHFCEQNEWEAMTSTQLLLFISNVQDMFLYKICFMNIAEIQNVIIFSFLSDFSSNFHCSLWNFALSFKMTYNLHQI